MKLSNEYLETFESAKEIKDAILLRRSIISNSKMNPNKGIAEAVDKSLNEEVEQLKIILRNKFKEEFD